MIVHGTEQIIRFERAARDHLTLMLLGCAFKVMAVTRLDTVTAGAPSEPFARVDLIQFEIPCFMA